MKTEFRTINIKGNIYLAKIEIPKENTAEKGTFTLYSVTLEKADHVPLVKSYEDLKRETYTAKPCGWTETYAIGQCAYGHLVAGMHEGKTPENDPAYADTVAISDAYMLVQVDRYDWLKD